SRPRDTKDSNWHSRKNRGRGKGNGLNPAQFKRPREGPMIENSYYSQDVHGPYELHDIGNLELEEGGTIRGCTLAYAIFGTLNAAKDNAILDRKSTRLNSS